ncbi:MAG: hypothetical protein IKH30_01530 [Clostridia bacterium]|nr:hypothetical protein [Clostridia bacterium]MBR4537244.1 hypothetical protein [Clostridia bacterium]MBR4540525.1 hypothetical protein [Clostridia bacterium]
MKKYSIVVTLIALGLLFYILIGQPSPDKTTGAQTASSYSASVYQPAAQPKATAKPAAKKTAMPSPKPTAKPATKTYILNKSSRVFHKPSCSSVKQMKDSNKRTYTGTRAQVVDMGYRPCQRCKP